MRWGLTCRCAAKCLQRLQQQGVAHFYSPRTRIPPLSFASRATEKLLSSALGSSDVEAAGPAPSSHLAPVWVQQAERIRVEMNLVKDRIIKLKE